MMVEVPKPHRCMNCVYGKILNECLAIDFYVTECTSTDDNADRLNSCAPITECKLWKSKKPEQLNQELYDLRKQEEERYL